jgi:hypothetical protein
MHIYSCEKTYLELCKISRNAYSHKMRPNFILNVLQTVNNVEHDCDVMNQCYKLLDNYHA